jgi:tetratricopeptide (TPR) repeat protein
MTGASTMSTRQPEKWTARDALENQLPHIFKLEREGQVDEALAWLDSVLEANRARDHDGWLAGSVAHHRAAMLWETERYVEAAQAYRAWAELGFLDVWRRRMYALGLASTLDALGRAPEAVVLLEEALGHDDPKDVPFAICLLAELARLSEKLGLPVDPKWLSLTRDVAECYGVDLVDKGAPGPTILALEETVSSMKPKRTKRARDEPTQK